MSKPFEIKPPIGCAACKCNIIGVCSETGKEIGVAYILRRNQGRPRGCPFRSKDGEENNQRRVYGKTSKNSRNRK